MTSNLEEGDLAIFVRDNSRGGSSFGMAGEVVTVGKPYNDGINKGFYIFFHDEEYTSTNGNKYSRGWFRANQEGEHNVYAVLNDLEPLTKVDVGDLEDDF